MDAAFTMQPRCPKPFAVFVLGVLGDAKAKIAIKGDRCIHIGTKAVEMINSKWLYPLYKGCDFDGLEPGDPFLDKTQMEYPYYTPSLALIFLISSFIFSIIFSPF